MKVKRLTQPRFNLYENCNERSQYKYITNLNFNILCVDAKMYRRLAAIEDILGDDYDLNYLRELVQADKERKRGIPLQKWIHLGGDEWCCKSCGNVIYTEGSWEKPRKKYCEECGAKMDVEQEEE